MRKYGISQMVVEKWVGESGNTHTAIKFYDTGDQPVFRLRDVDIIDSINLFEVIS